MQFAVENLHKSFGEKHVLRNVSFSTESGKAFGLLGRNGAGKTTSIRIIMDVFPADSGRVLLDGKPMVREKVNIGYLPEERGLYPKVNILEQLVYLGRLRGLSAHDAKENSMKWLRRLDMDQFANKKLDTLSKGNQQKIQLTAALVSNPDFVILDEPFSGLDPVNAMLLKDVVKEQIERGKIVLFSSHQMHYIEEFCDDIAILRKGKVALAGGLHDIKRNYVRDRLIVRTETPEPIRQDLKDRCMDMPDGGLMIQLADPGEKREMMRLLTERYELDEVKVFEPSLNDIFVQYAGDTEEKGGKNA